MLQGAFFKEAPKPGERKSDMDGRDNIPLRLTARGGYLEVEEVARLLLFTGKTFMADVFGDLKNSSDKNARQLVEDDGPFRYYHNVELTRNIEMKNFGFTVTSFSGKKDGIGCQFTTPDATMQSSETIEEEDVIISINEKDVRGWKCSDAAKEISSIRGNVLIISIRRFCPDTNMHIWKCICQHKWRDSRALSQLMQNVGRRKSNGEADWEGLFRKFCAKKKNVNFRPFAVFSYSFLVSVYDSVEASLDSAPVACLVIDNQNAQNLVVKGKTGWIELDSPTNIGTFKSLEDVEEKIGKWGIGLHVLRKMDRMSRKVDIQPLDSGSLSLLDDGDGGNDSAGGSGNSDHASDNGDDVVKSYYYTRKRAVRDLKGLVAGGDFSGIITGARVGVNSHVDIELKRNLRCSVQVHNSGKHVCFIDAVSVDALIRVVKMGENERIPFSEHQKIKRGVTLTHFLSRIGRWE